MGIERTTKHCFSFEGLTIIAKYTQAERRCKLATAEDFAETLCAFLNKAPGVRDVVVAGSYRRRKDTIGDLDILVTCEHGPGAIQHFVGYEEVAQILAKGDRRSTIILKGGVQVDLRVVPEESYGAALHYFTGSKAHNIAVRRLGQLKGLKINEYGVCRFGSLPY
jgi:DNA polymerase (family 10)